MAGALGSGAEPRSARQASRASGVRGRLPAELRSRRFCTSIGARAVRRSSHRVARAFRPVAAVGAGGPRDDFDSSFSQRDAAGDPTMTILREYAEQQFAEELRELTKADTRPRPPNWKLSPWAVSVYILGGKLDNGFEVAPKYIGSRRLMEIAIATLATDRALLLLGVPGTAKTWVSEHLAAAISGDSTLLVQGTSGTSEESIRYGWNYARLLAEGPSRAALVPSPLMVAAERGQLARVEELTRIPSDVQDSLITLLSEKVIP